MSRPATRGAITLALAAAVAVAAGLSDSPVTAAKGPATRGFVRKLVKRKVGAVRNQLMAEIRDARTATFSTAFFGPFALNGVNLDVPVASVDLPDPGAYVILAKLWWRPTPSTSTGAGGEIDCDLLAGGDFDTSRGSGVGDFDFGTLSLQLTHRTGGAATATVRCKDEFSGGNSVEVHNLHLLAIRVGSLDTSPARVPAPAAPGGELQREPGRGGP